MTLKDHKFLKLFTILVFCLELLAPIFLAARMDFIDDAGTKSSIRETSGTIALFATFLSEEAGSEEERDGKEHTRILCFLAEFTFVPVYKLSVTIEKISSPKGFSNSVSTHASIFSLYRVFRI